MQMRFFAFLCISRRRSFFCTFCIFFFNPLSSVLPPVSLFCGHPWTNCATCTILNGGGDAFAFFLHRTFCSPNLHPPPPRPCERGLC